MPPQEVEVLPLGAVTQAVGALLPLCCWRVWGGGVMALPWLQVASAPLLSQLHPLSSSVFSLSKASSGVCFLSFLNGHFSLFRALPPWHAGRRGREISAKLSVTCPLFFVCYFFPTAALAKGKTLYSC